MPILVLYAYPPQCLSFFSSMPNLLNAYPSPQCLFSCSMPILLFPVIDDLCRDRQRVVDELGDKAAEDIASIAGAISKLKYQMQTDKQLTLLNGS